MNTLHMRYLKKSIVLILGVCTLMFLPSISLAQKDGKLTGIAFGLRMGRVEVLDLTDLSMREFQTNLGKTLVTVGVAHFSNSEKLVFEVIGMGDYHDVGIIHLPTGELKYWESATIGLGGKILSISLSASLPNHIYGDFAEKSWQDLENATKEEIENFEKSMRTGAFNVENETWEEVSYSGVTPDLKLFPGRLEHHPEWEEKYEPIWQVLLAQQLLPQDEERHTLLWADERYVLFRSGEELVLGRREDQAIVVEKHIPKSAVQSDGDILHPDSVAFMYSKNEYILASTQEEAMNPVPCQIYRTNTREQCLSQIAEIPPQKGIRLVSAYPQDRTLAIWRYEEHDTGSLVIVNVDKPEESHTVQLPFTPTSGGYRMKDSEEEAIFVAWAGPDEQKQLYAYSVASGHLEQIQHVQWETAIIRGFNALREGGQVLNVMVNPESGEITYYSGDFNAQLPFRLDEESRQIFSRLETTTTMIWGNNEHMCVVGAQEAGENPEQFFVFLYDKEKQTWTHFAVKGIHSHIQVFDEWIVIQQAFPNTEDPNDPLILTGEHTFYHLDSGEQFVWQTDSQTEVLGIWEDTILYRIEDGLFEAAIAGTEVTEAQLLCQDPAIQDVHWAFIVP